MNETYPARYTDLHGTSRAVIHNDGKLLHMDVRGVRFSGPDWDMLEPDPNQDSEAVASFCLNHGELCDCVIECEMPLPVVIESTTQVGGLQVRLELGRPGPSGGLDREILQLGLRIEGRIYSSSGISGWFEDELLDIQGQLPTDTYMKACMNCLFSDYSVAGHGLFGGMACFRDNREAYLAVRTKRDYLTMHGSGPVYFVQETYLCPEFQRRRPGTGYRG